MNVGIWENYDREEQEFEQKTERGPVTSELEASDRGLREIERELGFSLDEAFDRYVRGENSNTVGGGTHAAAGTENGEVVLEAFRDAPLSSLAHESVHGILMQSDSDAELPDGDPWDQILYEEFVARKAESKFEELNTTELELRELADSRKAYEEARQRYEEFLPDEKLDLNQEIGYLEAIEDNEVRDDLCGKADDYRDNRNSVLAKEAAKKYKGDKNLQDLIDPDAETYREALKHIKNVGGQVFREYRDET